jgi:hypothetical protein
VGSFLDLLVCSLRNQALQKERLLIIEEAFLFVKTWEERPARRAGLSPPCISVSLFGALPILVKGSSYEG